MCGLGAIVRFSGAPIEDAWIDLIDRRIAYRGPDGSGRYADGGGDRPSIALVHRRLSIIDHVDGGQPMISDTGRSQDEGLVAVISNGCLYNHHALREELSAEGHVFQSSHSDTEVLIHGYRQWGESLTEHLEGMYAFVIWNGDTGEICLGRDWYGEKPLYLARTDDNDWVIASDARAVAEVLEAMTGRPTPRGVPAWTTGYLSLGYGSLGRTAWGDGETTVESHPPGLPPGILLGESDWPRWRIDSDREACEQEIEECLANAVARRLDADVPIGCFLSGGVDSTLVAHYAHQARPDIRTFCMRIPESRYDESPHAERVADHIGTMHTTLEPSTQPAEDLVTLVHTLGQPFGDSSILPTFWLCREASAHVTVALAGDGGDELFYGYERHVAARYISSYGGVLRLVPRWIGRSAHPKSRLSKIGRLGEMARNTGTLGLLALEAILTPQQIRSIIDVPPDAYPTLPPGADPMRELRNFDICSYLPHDLLTKIDTASMACAMEVRCPFLDRDLGRLVLAGPPSLLAGGERKAMLRAIARRLVPRDVIDRPKMGFAIPVGEWFRTNHGSMRDLLLDHLHATEPLGSLPCRTSAIRALVDDHLRGRADYSQQLFALLTLSIWSKSLPEPAPETSSGYPLASCDSDTC